VGDVVADTAQLGQPRSRPTLRVQPDAVQVVRSPARTVEARMDEGQKLQQITRTAKNPVRLRRAIVVMMSGQGQIVRDITSYYRSAMTTCAL